MHICHLYLYIYLYRSIYTELALVFWVSDSAVWITRTPGINEMQGNQLEIRDKL